MLRMTLTQGSSLPDFFDLRARILAFDAQRQDMSSSLPTATALYHRTSSSPNRRDQRGGNHRDQRSKQNFRSNRHQQNQWRHSSPGGLSYPQNQYMQYSNMSQPFVPWASRALGLLGPAPTWCTNCNSGQHGLAQCPHRYSGPNSTPPFAGAHFVADPNWYPDTGATHHMTAMPLQNAQPHNGPHNVFMGNGDSMPISHTGNLPLPMGHPFLILTMSFVFHPFVRIFCLLLTSRRIILFSFFFLLISINYIVYVLVVYFYKAHVKTDYIHSHSLPRHRLLILLRLYTRPSGTTVLVIHHLPFLLVLYLVLGPKFLLITFVITVHLASHMHYLFRLIITLLRLYLILFIAMYGCLLPFLLLAFDIMCCLPMNILAILGFTRCDGKMKFLLILKHLSP